jgi:prevent-host-death family protein
MTMSSSRWNIAAAKAELSRVLRRARNAPQVIENRGEPVAVVIGVDDYRRLSDRDQASRRWKRFLDLSEALRADGGVELELPPRRSRPSPFERKRR